MCIGFVETSFVAEVFCREFQQLLIGLMGSLLDSMIIATIFVLFS